YGEALLHQLRAGRPPVLARRRPESVPELVQQRLAVRVLRPVGDEQLVVRHDQVAPVDPLQPLERAAEPVAQLLLARQPDRLVLLDVVERPLGGAVEPDHGAFGQLVDLDRKSTRLNSSHVKISYAVFCLKKKKKGSSTVPSERQEMADQPSLLNRNSSKPAGMFFNWTISSFCPSGIWPSKNPSS